MVLRVLQGLFGRTDAASRVDADPDRVWLSREAKLAGIRRELHHRAGRGPTMIALVAHFPDVLEDLERIVAEAGTPASARAVLARQLAPEAAGRLPLGEADVIDLIVAERHPLASVDDELVAFAGALPCRARMVHHVSLDDALLRTIAGGSLRTTLDRLGATEEEAISHAMVTRSIRRAQEKLESRATERMEAGSASEWIERNVRP